MKEEIRKLLDECIENHGIPEGFKVWDRKLKFFRNEVLKEVFHEDVEKYLKYFRLPRK